MISDDVAFAFTEATPASSRAGNTINVPPPASAFAAPPARAASSSRIIVTGFRPDGDGTARGIRPLPRYQGLRRSAPARSGPPQPRPAHPAGHSSPGGAHT